jgi:hypothetical protein
MDDQPVSAREGKCPFTGPIKPFHLGSGAIWRPW